MSSTADKVSRRSARRPHDAQASRRALLDAADALFDERGYEAATIREIGDRAGVDAALIARYFGGKEALYLATLQQEGRPPMPTDPHELLGCMLSRSDQRGSGPVPLAMVTPTLSDGIREQVREIVGRRVLDPLAAQLAAGAAPDAELRAELLVAIAVGISLTRAGGTLPILAGTPIDELLGILAPLVAALQDGA